MDDSGLQSALNQLPQNLEQPVTPPPVQTVPSTPTPPTPPLPPETPQTTPAPGGVTKTVKKHGKKFIVGALMLLLLAGGAWFGVTEVQKRQTAEQQALVSGDCLQEDEEGECLEPIETDTEAVSLVADADAVDDDTVARADLSADIDENDDLQAQVFDAGTTATNQIFLKITYTAVGCIDGRPCEDPRKKTVVGWRGNNLSDGPFRVFGNSVKIPLTTRSGKWVKDKPVFRSSPQVHGLGVTRLGNGKVLISHSNSMIDRSQYRREFQAIDARMKIIGGATVSRFIQGDRGIAPDQPTMNGKIAGHGVDQQGNGTWSLPPTYEPRPCVDEVIWSAGQSTWEHHTRVCHPGDDYIMVIARDLAPSASPSPAPSPSASPNPSVACVDLTKDVDTPKVGDEVTFSCEASFSSTSNPVAFFRYSRNGGTSFSGGLPTGGVAVNATTHQASYNITIDQVGDWEVQCRVCGQVSEGAISLCTEWGKAAVNPGSSGLD